MQHSARTALMRIKVFWEENFFYRDGKISMQHSVRAALMGIKVSAAHPVNGLIFLKILKII